MDKKELIDAFLKKGLLISPDTINAISEGLDPARLDQSDLVVVNDEIAQLLQKDSRTDINWKEFEKSKVLAEKDKNFMVYNKFLDFLDTKKEAKHGAQRGITPRPILTFSYAEEPKKREFDDFVHYFNARYNSIEAMLRQRPELRNCSSISKVKYKASREEASIIVIVTEKQVTKNNNILLVVEDPTGVMKVLITTSKPALYAAAKDIVEDEVVGITGVMGDKIIFANSIINPDVPTTTPFKKGPLEDYAVFLSDLHVGSQKFLPKEFSKFLKWINCESGTGEQQRMAQQVRHIFIAGDLVDGVGIYPDQDAELDVKDIYEQYKVCAEYLAEIPADIQIIICPGNHDALRISEPQPPLSTRFAEPLVKLPNVTAVSNPAYVNIGASEGFPGFDVLLYHGYSFDHYVAHVDSIRSQGGYDRADLIMKFLLQRRHLAPTHGDTPYIPDSKNDNLVISKIPDFFATGHIHKSSVSNYRNITLICGSCWQSKTLFQERVGHHPQPARVPIVNLKTRAVRILRFGA